MPTKQFLDEANFVDMYNKFVAYSSYMQQWSQSVSDLGAQIQAHPLYATALSSDEQTSVASLATTAVTAVNSIPKSQPVQVGVITP